jgi:Cu/Zn superoxide dismutase
MNRILFFICILIAGMTNKLHADHLSSHLQFSAKMSGANEVPAVTTDAQGIGIFTLDEKKTTLYVNVSLNNLSGPITGMHIHEGTAGQNGGVVYDLVPFLSGNRAKGVLRDISHDVITKLLNGSYYINVHTSLNPGGEIRGQIGLETDYRYTALMGGVNEVPEVTTDGRGLGIFQLNHSKTSVHIKVLFQGLSSDVTGAHIHHAAIGSNGPVIFDLVPILNGNSIEGDWEPGANLDALLAGELYINVHTMNHPGGEIRGQITLMPGITFDASFSGDQENPVVNTSGSALGVVTVWPELTEVEYYIVYDSLSGPLTGAHFHQGATGTNGGVVIDMSDNISPTGNFISGTDILTVDILNTLLNGGFYMNLHTTDNPGGEIRGQVYPYAREGYIIELNGGQEVPAVTTSGGGVGLVSIDRDETSAHYMFVVNGLEGTFSAAHFHNAGPGVNGGVIYDIADSFNDFGGADGYWDAGSNPVFDASPLFKAGQVYANVHTSTHPGGEIRGNVVRSSNLFGELPFDPGFSDHLLLAAMLSGNEVVPAVTTNAIGLATMYFDADKTKAKINITATGLSGPITGIDIYEGDVGANGTVLYSLVNVGNRVQMDITDIAALALTSIMNNATYVSIKTAAHPDGEIRGQLGLEQDVTFYASMRGESEVPEVVTDALGLAVIHYTVGQLSIDIDAQLTGLSGDITGVHLHNAAPDANGPVIVDLEPYLDGNKITGRIDMSIENLVAIFSGTVYINVHTTNHGTGEIRGQLNFLPGVTFDGWMSGIQEVPFTTSLASGLTVGTIFPGPTDITLWMLVDGLSGPVGAAHLHNAPLQENGGVVHDLTDDIVGNSLLHFGVIQDGVLSSLLSGGIYINAHTAAYPGGELRGQLYRNAREGYGFDLCKEQETGVVEAPDASGSGMVSVDRNHTNISVHVVYDGLTGPMTASHIHRAGIGTNGSVIADLTPFYANGGLFVDGAAVDTALINPIRTGETYVNVHTALHSAGEIRGQIVQENLCTIEVGVDPLADIISDVHLSPVPVYDFLNVTIESQMASELSFSVVDISGKILSAQTKDLFQGENVISVNTESLLPGFYIMMIANGKAAQAYKFIK